MHKILKFFRIIAISFLEGYSNESVSESNITVSSIVLANDIGVIVLTLFVSENFYDSKLFRQGSVDRDIPDRLGWTMVP